MKVYIVGMGPGHPDFLTIQGKRAVEESRVILGDRRMTDAFSSLGKTIISTYKPSEIRRILASMEDGDGPAAVVVSGDVGFFSLGRLLTDIPGCTVISCPGISSLAYFAAKVRTPWHDAYCISRHGRRESVAAAVYGHHKVFCLTGGSDTVSLICRELCQAGLGHVRVDVGQNLSYDDEQILSGTAEALAAQDIGGLAVMMIYNDHPRPTTTPVHGLPDDAFVRGGAPMTKRSVRAVAISHLAPQAGDCVYDVGAGTGSCTVELARQVPFGQVYAFEIDKEALSLVQENCRRFAVENVSIVPGDAAETMEPIPAPDCAFIGGTKGKMADILDGIYGKNAACRIVMTAITIETLADITAYYKDKTRYTLDITQLSAAESRRIGPYHMMMGQNPVYILTVLSKEDCL